MQTIETRERKKERKNRRRCNCRVTDLAYSKTIASVDAAFILARYMKFQFGFLF